MNIKILCSVAIIGALVSGCGLKSPFAKKETILTEQGCEAFNFDTLLLTKGKASRFIDRRSIEERNFQNGLWSVEEYCKMSDYTLTKLIVEYGDRTNYTNLINVKNEDGINVTETSPTVIEIVGSARNYSYQGSSFNFIAMRGGEIIRGKEGQEMNLDGLKYKFYNTREYTDSAHPWQITVECVTDGRKKTLNLDKNKFFLGSYKIMF